MYPKGPRGLLTRLELCSGGPRLRPSSATGCVCCWWWDTQRVASLVDRLKPYAEKHMVARATIESVSPSKPRDEQAPHVVKGQLAPAFSAELLEGQGVVSRFRSGKWKMPWMHVFAGFDFQAPLPAAFQLNGIPFAVLVDARGNVVATQSQLRGEELEKTLDALLPARAP